MFRLKVYFNQVVSIQPKPKKGLVETVVNVEIFETEGFNPAEAEEGFSRQTGK